MTFTLGNPVLWPFLALVAVPLLLHLFARAKPPVYWFSSVEFIRRVLRKTLRIKRPQDWLLLFLRTLTAAALVLAFLQPVLYAKGRLASAFQRKNTVLIVDATASMAYTEGAQARFAAACAEASEILSGLSGRDTANIVWLDAVPDAVFPDMGANLGYLRNVLRRASVSAQAGDPHAAMALAASLLEGAEGKREIYLISDFQRTGWEDARLETPAGADVVRVKIGDREGGNTALTEIRCDPPKVLAGEEVQISCEARNYSSLPKRTTVFLEAGESRQSQEISIPPWQRTAAVFKFRARESGFVPVAASLTEDAFPGDDRRWAILEVQDALRVGLLAEEPATAAVWRKALRALGWGRTEPLSPPDLERPLPYDALLLAGWDGARVENVRQSLAQGCTVVWYPGAAPRVSPDATVRALLGMHAPRETVPLPAWQVSAVPHRVRVGEEGDPAFRVFAGGERGDPARGRFQARLLLSATALPAGKPLLAYDDGVPALVRFQAKPPARGGARGGVLWLWNLPLNTEFTDWAGHPEFLVLAGEMLLTSRAPGQETAGDARPGDPLSWRADRNVLLADVALKTASGQTLPVRERQDPGGSGFVSDPIREPGLYAWHHQDKIVTYNVVNFPPMESDLRALGAGETTKGSGVLVTSGSTVRRMREGARVWPYLVALGVTLALAEGCVLLWAGRR